MNQGYSASLAAPDTVAVERQASGTIYSTFLDAASEQNIPYPMIDAFVDLFSNRVEFKRNIHPGDSFTIRYIEKRTRDGAELISTGPILDASLFSRGVLRAAIRYGEIGGKPNYFDEHGRALGNYFLRYPLQFSRVSSFFSWARFHPLLQRSMPHLGVDFAAPAGTPVRAVAGGIVTSAGYGNGSGNKVALKHGARYATAYLHLSRFARGIGSGATVERGQIIGYVGSTGISTGPHLHFALFDRGKYIDPMRANVPALNDALKPIPQTLLRTALLQMEQEHKRFGRTELALAMK